MAEEGKSRYDKREKELEKHLNIRIIHLQDQLKDKEEQLENFQTQFKKLYDDFSYNLELIYERDKDIESLNKRVQEMTKIISSKDSEIRDLKQNSQRLKQIEQENTMLYKKLESLTQDRQVKIPGQYLEPRAPRLDYKNLLKDNRNTITKKISSFNNSISIEKNQISLSKEPINIDTTTKPILELNFDLEERIKALQEENSSKDRKSSSLANSRVLETTPEYDEDIPDYPKKIEKMSSLHIKNNTLENKSGKKQEKEIGELIKSLQMFKKQSDANSRSKLRTYDDQISALNEDIEKLRSGDVRSASRNGQSEDGDRKYKPFVRPRSSFEAR